MAEMMQHPVLSVYWNKEIARPLGEWNEHQKHLVDRKKWEAHRAVINSTKDASTTPALPATSITTTPTATTPVTSHVPAHHAKPTTNTDDVLSDDDLCDEDSDSDLSDAEEEVDTSNYTGNSDELVGRTILCYFPEVDSTFKGTVVSWVCEDEETDVVKTGRILYHVLYEDNEQEDFYWGELSGLLLED